MIPWDEDDFAELGAAFEEQHPARVGPVGNATARLLNQRALVDFGVGWMESHRR
jgi:aminoglycoside 3-N-acetyltransferase